MAAMKRAPLKQEIIKYIELTGHVRRSPATGVTLVSPTINEICEMYSTTAEEVAGALIEMNITSGTYDAKRKKE